MVGGFLQEEIGEKSCKFFMYVHSSARSLILRRQHVLRIHKACITSVAPDPCRVRSSAKTLIVAKKEKKGEQAAATAALQLRERGKRPDIDRFLALRAGLGGVCLCVLLLAEAFLRGLFHSGSSWPTPDNGPLDLSM